MLAKVFSTTAAAASDAGGLTPVLSSADASLSGTVGQLDVIDISGYSADRTYTLPATAAVGDLCGVMLSAGDTAYELLITAAGGDTLNGIAGGTEWSRVFITNEVVTFVCIVANTTWMVDYDGRIPMVGVMRLTTLTDLTQSAGVYWLPTDEGGVWTSYANVGAIVDTATSKITIRRACQANVASSGRPQATADGETHSVILSLNGTTPTIDLFGHTQAAGTNSPIVRAAACGAYAAGDTLQFMVRNNAANRGMLAYSPGEFTFTEVL